MTAPRIVRASSRPPFVATCKGCRVKIQSDVEPGIFADLNGEPFRAYYCGPCATPLQQRQRVAERLNA